MSNRDPRQPDLFAATKARDVAMARVGAHAEDACPSFSEQARACVVRYLTTYGPTAGERLTAACKAAGLVPHDDRAFGPVYFTLARRGVIEKVGDVRRARGHGTAGGTVWALRREAATA